MKTTQRRMAPVDEESETGKLAAVRDVDPAEENRAEMHRGDEMDRAETDRAQSDRGAMDGAHSDRQAMDRDQALPTSSGDMESETPVPQGDTATPQGDMATPPSFTAAFGNSRRETPRETPRAEMPHLADQASAQAGQRWQEILAGFVDDPRRAVGDAHQLVGEVMQRMIDGFTAEREKLERQWSTGGDVSTEDLRVCLQNYRAFFARLLPAADR
jgi:hypothetical protein